MVIDYHAIAPRWQQFSFGWFPSSGFKAINLTIFPFALSLSKGENKNPTHWKLNRSWFDKPTTNGLT